MARLGVVAAARLAGVSRSTIHRYCSNGRLSSAPGPSGGRLIDTSELSRVFDGLQPPETLQRPSQRRVQRPPDTVAAPGPEVAALRRHVEHLERELERLRHELEAERRERQQATERLWELTTRYVRALPAPEAPQQPRRRPRTGNGPDKPLSPSEAATVLRDSLTGWLRSFAAPLL